MCSFLKNYYFIGVLLIWRLTLKGIGKHCSPFGISIKGFLFRRFNALFLFHYFLHSEFPHIIALNSLFLIYTYITLPLLQSGL